MSRRLWRSSDRAIEAGDSLFAVLGDRVYRHLYLAQVVALVGTGLATVALGLLAYGLAGRDASAVLGTALAIKMIAYVLVAPLAGAYASRVSRRALLVGLDLIRLVVVLALPFVNQIWQIYVLIFVLQSCSAAFTPTFQATIPTVLPAEREYTKALSLSRLAYDLEALLSPALAALLLLVVSYNVLFVGTALGFLGSALLVTSVILPAPIKLTSPPTIRNKLTRGMRIYLLTPRLRGLLALNMAAAAGSAMVIVNTAVIVRDDLHRADRAVALALASFGAGSMIVALLLPRILQRFGDRVVMAFGSVVLTLVLAVEAAVWNEISANSRWVLLLLGWLVLGAAYASIVTPGGRLLRRSSHESDRPAVFSAQFSLSHICWLIAYPVAGWLGSRAGTAPTLWAMTALAALGAIIARALWPVRDAETLAHRHDDLPADHPHLAGTASGREHAHAYVIDDLHIRWPT